MKKKIILIFLIFTIATSNSSAQENLLLISRFLENPQITGKARFSLVFIDIYDAYLYAPNGSFDKEKSFALELAYLKDIKGKEIAETSVKKIREQNFKDEIKIASWYSQMHNIFPDVKKGDSIIGIKTKDKEAVFFKDDKEIGRIKDKEFSKYFFDIWLGVHNKQTREFRAKLISDQ